MLDRTSVCDYQHCVNWTYRRDSGVGVTRVAQREASVHNKQRDSFCEELVAKGEAFVLTVGPVGAVLLTVELLYLQAVEMLIRSNCPL